MNTSPGNAGIRSTTSETSRRMRVRQRRRQDFRSTAGRRRVTEVIGAWRPRAARSSQGRLFAGMQAAAAIFNWCTILTRRLSIIYKWSIVLSSRPWYLNAARSPAWDEWCALKCILQGACIGASTSVSATDTWHRVDWSSAWRHYIKQTFTQCTPMALWYIYPMIYGYQYLW